MLSLQWISLEPQLSAENEVLIVFSDVPETVNSMRQVAAANVLTFSFSYSCKSFSTMNLIKSDIRNSLSYKIFFRYKTFIICHCLNSRCHIDFTKSPKHIICVLIINNSESSKK